MRAILLLQAAMPMSELVSSRRSFGDLSCQIVETASDRADKLLVVLCHGFGAPGDDLVGLAAWLIEELEERADECRFVFPEAPLDMTPLGLPGGRAWWPINMAMLAELNQTQDFDELAVMEPDGMQIAGNHLVRSLRAVQQEFRTSDQRTVLGGFSQGAMVCTDIVLRHGITPAALVLFSGTLLCRKKWSSLAESHPGCPVLQSHGTFDPVLPFALAEQLRDLLLRCGFRVEFQPFRGQHAIPPNVLQRLADRLQSLLGPA